MTMHERLPKIIAGLAAACLGAALTVRATNTPVFRHALEFWPASEYEVVIPTGRTGIRTTQPMVGASRLVLTANDLSGVFDLSSGAFAAHAQVGTAQAVLRSLGRSVPTLCVDRVYCPGS